MIRSRLGKSGFLFRPVLKAGNGTILFIESLNCAGCERVNVTVKPEK